METREIRLAGRKKLTYRVTGEGPVVVLLHGFAEDGLIWENQYTGIDGYRFLVPDLPGSGQSDLIGDMSMEGLASAVQEMVRAELPSDKQLKISLIGHSMGGYITLAFAEKFPEWLNGFGLFHSTAFADTPEKKEARQKGIEFIQKQGVEAFLQPTIANLYASETRAHRPELLEEHLKRVYNFSDAALVSYYESMMGRPDRTHILKQSKVPVLFILGKWDNAVPVFDGLKQGHLPEICYIHILEHSGHMGMREEKEQSNTFISNYLTNLQNRIKPVI